MFLCFFVFSFFFSSCPSCGTKGQFAACSGLTHLDRGCVVREKRETVCVTMGDCVFGFMGDYVGDCEVTVWVTVCDCLVDCMGDCIGVCG